MPDEPVDIAARRWEAATSCKGLPPADALKAALRAIESGDLNPDHVLVCCGCVDGDAKISTRVFSAGEFDLYGQLGLLDRSKTTITRD